MSAPPVFVTGGRPEDVPALVALERRSFSHPWTARAFDDAVRDTGHGRVLILRAAPAPRDVLAYCIFRTVADEMEIHNLAVEPSHRGHGLGRRLMRLALWLAARRGARTALLEVRASNEPAIRLYRGLGFDTAGVRRDYYSHPREDAYVLRKTHL